MPFITSYDEYPEAIEFYDHVIPYRDRHDVQFFVGIAKEFGGPVLELGCGTGRILIPTAREGIPITGIDLSEKMLDLCRKKIETESKDVQSLVKLLQSDMISFKFKEKYSLITTPFRSFQPLLFVEDQLKCLESARNHLIDDGVFILDVFNPYFPALVDDAYMNEWSDEAEFTMPDGRRVIRSNRIVSRDYAKQINRIEFIYYVTHPDGFEERIVQQADMRYFFKFELEHLLARCGFSIKAIYSDYDKTPYGKKYPGELIFVTSKK